MQSAAAVGSKSLTFKPYSSCKYS